MKHLLSSVALLLLFFSGHSEARSTEKLTLKKNHHLEKPINGTGSLKNHSLKRPINETHTSSRSNHFKPLKPRKKRPKIITLAQRVCQLKNCVAKNLACCGKNSKKLDKIIDILQPRNETFTHIIVGAGTAGSTLGYYLSNDPKNKVLIIEAGENLSQDPVVKAGVDQLGQNIPLLLNNKKYSVNALINEPAAGTTLGVQFSAGKQWGGSSGHNFFLANRGTKAYWDELAQITNDQRWTYNNLLPIFKAIETYTPNGTIADFAQRGSKGPLFITQAPSVKDLPFAQAVSEATGAPLDADYNVAQSPTAVSADQHYSNPITGERSYAVTAFLPSTVISPDGIGVGKRNLRILSGATATRVLFDGTTAIGVDYVDSNGQSHQVFASESVTLSAGAPLSAGILQRSGVGPAAVLKPLGIEVIVDSPKVGDGLKVQYGILGALTPPDEPGNFGAYVDGRPFFPADNTRRLQYIFIFAAALSLELQNALNLTGQPFITTIGWNLRPRSNGTAFIVSKDPFTLPEIKYNLYTDGSLSDPDSDLSVSVAALKILENIADQAGETLLYPAASHFSSDEQLASDARGSLSSSASTITNHYVGTCNMGTSLADSVTDSSGRVRGTRKLWVADNSLFSFPETGNTAWQAFVAGAVVAQRQGAKIPTS